MYLMTDRIMLSARGGTKW